MLVKLILLTLLLLVLCLRFALAGYCNENYSCPSTCYRQSRYKTRCGFLKLRRCTRYRQRAYTCTKTCSRRVCCKGYIGSSCTTPMCYGITTCPNGACVAPDNCRCLPGFSGPRCSDIDECASGAAGCAQVCKNTHGSYECSCNSGYVLASDKKSCIDVNECGKNNGGCEQTCINEQGSSRCECRTGYSLNQDRKTCSDVNECTAGTSQCQHVCTNTVGSYTCSCNPGYELALGGKTCKDVDECSAGTANCGHTCTNTVGSFICSCRDGFELMSDGRTCQDKDECSAANGGCEQVCTNEAGSYSCSCDGGFRLNADDHSCTDIDECEEKISGCSQSCTNTVGSFTCGCSEGYALASNGKDCIDIDDCVDVVCQNGGQCVDGLASFTCVCKTGYTGEFCESDIDECSFLNGGCEDLCTNKQGTFECSCENNRTLNKDGVSCTGKTGADNVFRRHRIARRLLPVGCSSIVLTRCKDGKNIEVHLSSTSDWFMSKTDNRVLFTLGIVFVEVNALSLPISLSGVEVHQRDDEFTIKIDVHGHTESTGLPVSIRRTDDCLSFDVTPRDIFDFISSVSFLKSFLDSVVTALPDWVKLAVTNTSILNVQDLKSDLVYGSKMDDITWCKGAPVIPDHLYSVFEFDSSFSLSVYNNEVKLPNPLDGKKFCLIVDICHNYGGSVFLMIPPESRDILSQLKVFKTLQEKQDLTVKPRGIGLSVVKGVNVHYTQKELQLWNGDHLFKYPIFDRGDLWLGGEVIKKSSSFEAEGEADLYISVPRPDRILTAVFIDEWNTLVKMKFTFTPTLKFKLFGKHHSVTFKDLAVGNMDAYASVGGTQPRQWCGDTANPPGIFLSALINVSPFQNVPILKEWVLESANIMYGYLTTDPGSKVTEDMKIDIVQDILELDEMVKRFETLLKSTLQKFYFLVTETTKEILKKLEDAVEALKTTIITNLQKLLGGDISGLPEILTEMWKQYKEIEKTVTDFLDETEHQVDEAKDNFILLVKNETENIKKNIDNAIKKLTDQAVSAAKDYTGWGMKYRTSLTLFGLKLPGIDIELVYSANNLFGCSRFDKVNELLKGEKAMRVLGRLSKAIRIGYFLKVSGGAGIGGALGIETHTVILQLNAYINMLGIKTTGDLFISKKGLYFYIEGNVWNIFLAQIDVSAEVGKQWHQLTFILKGKFVAKARRKRQTQVVSKSFDASYLDALKKVTKIISDEADKRLSQAQNALSKAQGGLTKAQNWLEEKKSDVRKANGAFDKAVAGLERAKDKLEAAKGPFEKAIEKLNKAQKKVDDLCKIRSCKKVCVPGLKCKICRKKVFGVRIPYPCCSWTKCMISFPNPLCVAANLVCRGVRAIAFGALEAAKLFVKVPIAALDLAKGALSVAQVVVDKSRVVLKLAEGVLEVAKIGLEAAKGVLEVAKASLEAVKIVVGAAAKVLEFVIEYGLKNIIDVRNCGFEIEMSTTDLPVFDVSCEVNAFKLGWKTVGIRINFKNIFQSIWQAAKATINSIMKGLGSLINGRKRREISSDASRRMNLLIRKVRQTDIDSLNATLDVFNDTINVVNSTSGFNAAVHTDFDNRVLLFKQKCENMTKILAFLQETTETLFDIANETKSVFDEASSFTNQLVNFDVNELAKNVTLENADVSLEAAVTDYGLTSSDLEIALADAKKSFLTDPLLLELASTAQFSRDMIQSEMNSVDSSQILNSWILAMENLTKENFAESECVNFQDCLFFSISTLYDLYTEETHPKIDEINFAISDLEDNILTILQNSSLDVESIYSASVNISSKLRLLSEANIFCSEPPRFLSPMKNVTLPRGYTASVLCHVTANPSPVYQWYKNGEILLNEVSSTLVISNITDDDVAAYQCIAGNVVANITSDEAYLSIAESIDEYPELVQAECDKYNCTDTFGMCYIPHPTSCFKFIMCLYYYSGARYSQVMPCAFGTMWQSLPRPVCQRANLVNCENDPCRDGFLKSFDYEDGNDRTYWKCKNQRSIPACCPRYMRYDSNKSKCVRVDGSDHPCYLNFAG